MNSKQAAEISGLSVIEQGRLAKRGLLRYTPGTERNGAEYIYDGVGILSLVVVRTLRKGGTSYDAMRPVVEFINRLSPDQLDAAAERGETIIGGGPLIPRMIPRGCGVLNNTGEQFNLIHIPVALFWPRVKRSIAILEKPSVPHQ